MKNLIVLISIIIITLKINGQNFEWAKAFSGNDLIYSESIAVDNDAFVYVCGYFYSTVDFDPGPGVYNVTALGYSDIFVCKIDSLGNLIWVKIFQGPSIGKAFSLNLDSQSSIYITGSFKGTFDFDPGPLTFGLTSFGMEDIFVIKLDSLGNLVWAKSFSGVDSDSGSDIIIDSLNNVYVTGHFRAFVDFDPGPGNFYLSAGGYPLSDAFIVKLDPLGNLTWAKSITGYNAVFSNSIQLDMSNNIYVAGTYYGTQDFDPGPATYSLTAAASSDMFVLKLTNNGNFVWAKSMGGSSVDETWDVTIDQSGNVYTTGRFRGADFDPGPGSYILTALGSDSFVSKLDSLGNFVWAKKFTGPDGNVGKSIAVDDSGFVYVTGVLTYYADFDPGQGSFYLSSYNFSLSPSSIYQNDPEIYLSKLNSNGDFVWAISLGGPWNQESSDLALDINGNIYLTGFFIDTTDFDPGVAQYNLYAVNPGYNDAFILKLSQCTGVTYDITVAHALCNGGTGSATVTSVSGGVPPYTYYWSNGETTQAATGLLAGPHNVIIGTETCNTWGSVFIHQPYGIGTYKSSNPSTQPAPNCNGSVNLSAFGGVPPYNISWSSGITTGLCPGWYYATIIDANGCVKIDSVYVNFFTSVEDINISEVNIFPNPVSNEIKLKLDLKSSSELEIKLFNNLGQKVNVFSFGKLMAGENTITLKVEDLIPGVYQLQIIRENDIFTKKIIKI